MDEVIDSLEMIHAAFPGARIGMIESLGYFSFADQYITTDPQNIYPIDFEDFVSTAKKRLAERGIVLDHFHGDFSYQDCWYDGREDNRMDFGRIMISEQVIKSLGVNCGIVINSTG